LILSASCLGAQGQGEVQDRYYTGTRQKAIIRVKGNIEKYEASFGPIKRTDESPKFPMNFGGTVGEA